MNIHEAIEDIKKNILPVVGGVSLVMAIDALEKELNNCPHLDYGKSADKALGAYCTLKNACVEPEDCEKCEIDRVTVIEQYTKSRDGSIKKEVFYAPQSE